jgi:hypothetical protein
MLRFALAFVKLPAAMVVSENLLFLFVRFSG